MTTSYDYIILGAGCAGLSLAYFLSKQSQQQFRCLLIDKDLKQMNDRTWSFWQKGTSEFETIVENKYSHIRFLSSSVEKSLDIAPYQYKMIRSKAFYQFIWDTLKKDKRFEILFDQVLGVQENENECIVRLESREVHTSMAFSSIHFKDIHYGKHQNVLQHFKGWIIETEEPFFDPSCATFMDFKIKQLKDVRFMYVLPSNENSALVELAVFSNEIWSNDDYDEVLKNYIQQSLKIDRFKILEDEFGIIPMTTYPFEKHNSNRIKYIGTAGGWVKASSGYAFTRILSKAKLLAEALDNRRNVDEVLTAKNKFRFFDQVFLNAILSGKTNGEEVFSGLFKGLPPQLIFKFLDEKTNLIENIRLFTGPPTWAFSKAFFEEILVR